MNWIQKILCLFLMLQFPLNADLVEDQNKFALSLSSILSENTKTNFVICPFGIFSAMSMAYVGAKGDTASQMRHALKISRSDEDSFLNDTRELINSYQPPLISVANGMWVSNETTLLPDFSDKMTTYFKAEATVVNFSESEKTRTNINSWISAKTQSKIPELLQSGDITAATRLVLINAIYFEGDWAAPFSTNQTKTEPFYHEDKSFKHTPMMQQNGTFSYFENELVQGLELDFIKNKESTSEISCWILLPKKSLSETQEVLSVETLQIWHDLLKKTPVFLKIPKFCFSTRYNLNEPLIKLGMEKAFSPDADFSGIDGKEDLLISKVLHECFFSFHERGITASAATSVAVGLKSTGPKGAIPFIANRPFLFFLIDQKTKAILFMGKLMTPQICETSGGPHEQ